MRRGKRSEASLDASAQWRSRIAAAGGVLPRRRARYAPFWPLEMRADMVAGMLDYKSTTDLMRAIDAGDAPPPTAVRSGREPVWTLAAVEQFIARRHETHPVSSTGGPRFTLDEV